MVGRTLNLGILAHVDAGKTTLTERLLYAAGVIDEIGSVDDGTTQTDTLALERQRGITINSAVVSFAIDDVTVNLIDTPGHPDFIAEVERVLSVLDGAVLVVSAVEGVQPQTRMLMRALQRLRVPTLLFVNKIDRAGADDERVLAAIARAADAGDRRRWARCAASGRAPRVHAARATTPLPDPASSTRSPSRTTRMLAAYVDGRRRPVRAAPRGARGADEAGARAPGLLRLGAHRRRRRRADAPGSPSCCRPPRATPKGPSRARSSRSNAAPPARRSPTSACSRARCGPRPGALRRRRGKVTAIAVFDRGRRRAARASPRPGRSASCGGCADVQIGDAIGDAPGAQRAPLRPADAGDRRRSRAPGGPGAPAPRSPSSPSRTR